MDSDIRRWDRKTSAVVLGERTRIMPSGCIEWTGRHRTKDGYGRLRVNGRRVLAHRLAWELANGPVPDGMKVLHQCDNPPCVNHEHLFLGTDADNVADMVAKGRNVPCRRSGEEHPSVKLREVDVDEIRRLRGVVTQSELGDRYGVNRSTIGKIQRGERWT